MRQILALTCTHMAAAVVEQARLIMGHQRAVAAVEQVALVQLGQLGAHNMVVRQPSKDGQFLVIVLEGKEPLSIPLEVPGQRNLAGLAVDLEGRAAEEPVGVHFVAAGAVVLGAASERVMVKQLGQVVAEVITLVPSLVEPQAA